MIKPWPLEWYIASFTVTRLTIGGYKACSTRAALVEINVNALWRLLKVSLDKKMTIEVNVARDNYLYVTSLVASTRVLSITRWPLGLGPCSSALLIRSLPLLLLEIILRYSDSWLPASHLKWRGRANTHREVARMGTYLCSSRLGLGRRHEISRYLSYVSQSIRHADVMSVQCVLRINLVLYWFQ